MPSSQSVAAPEPGGEAEARAALFTLAAHLVLRELEPASLSVLAGADVVCVLEKLEAGCADYLDGRPWAPSDFDEAAADYCEVFILGKETAPYASAWLSGDSVAEGARIASRVREVAAELELDAAIAERIPADHLGVQLSLAAEAWKRDPATAQGLVDELLTPWAPAWGKALRSRSRNPLYRALASLIGQLVDGRVEHV